jgi:hypothetical protein
MILRLYQLLDNAGLPKKIVEKLREVILLIDIKVLYSITKTNIPLTT